MNFHVSVFRIKLWKIGVPLTRTVRHFQIFRNLFSTSQNMYIHQKMKVGSFCNCNNFFFLYTQCPITWFTYFKMRRITSKLFINKCMGTYDREHHGKVVADLRELEGYGGLHKRNIPYQNVAWDVRSFYQYCRGMCYTPGHGQTDTVDNIGFFLEARRTVCENPWYDD